MITCDSSCYSIRFDKSEVALLKLHALSEEVYSRVLQWIVM